MVIIVIFGRNYEVGSIRCLMVVNRQEGLSQLFSGLWVALHACLGSGLTMS